MTPSHAPSSSPMLCRDAAHCTTSDGLPGVAGGNRRRGGWWGGPGARAAPSFEAELNFGRAAHANKSPCQSASNFDPRSASNFDPLERRVRAVALAPSELVGVAETARARVGE